MVQQNEDGTPYVDPPLALLSYGSLALPQTMHMEQVADEITVTWSLEGHYQGIDLVMLMAYVPETKQTSYDMAAAKRYESEASLEMPYNPQGHAVHVYIAFVAFDHAAQSMSHYLGKIEF